MTENTTPTTTTSTPEAGSAPAPAPAPRTRTVRRTFQDYDAERGAYWTEEVEEIPIEEPKAAEPEQEQEQQQQEDDGPDERTIQTDVTLAVPEFLDPARARAVEGYFNDGLSEVVRSSGMSSDVANTLVQLAVDDAMGTAQVPLDDRNANEIILKNDWGAKFDERVRVVQQFVHRTPGLAEYLERTRLGNSPSVVRAIYLHASGVTTLSKAEAQRRLDEAMKPGSAYLKGDRAAVREVRALTHVLHDGGEESERPVAPKPAQATGLQAERTRLMQSPAFLDKRHADHAKTMAACQAVTEKLYPERG